MKASLNWLKEFVDIDVDVKTLCERLVSVGFEVEELIDLSEAFSGVFVGQILSVEQHPNADKLKVCQVNVGDRIVQIVTNAKHLQAGDKVPVSLDGAVLHDGTHIKPGELRGVRSEGMFCGGEELGADDDIYPGASGDSVLVLSENEKVGASMAEVLGFNDYVLDVGVTPNRPDCNSILGIAREVAVALGKTCKVPDISFTELSGTSVYDYVRAEVRDPDLCPGYEMQAVCDVKIEKSPLWMMRRLKTVGIRGINNLVDITNYVLTEIGQPMHAFDQRDINDKTVIVRRAKEGEKLTVLDGKECVLNSNNLVIADAEKPVGLAGVMGGKDSGIKDNTAAVVFESAVFAKESIRKTSRSLGVRSDSSARFEKGVEQFTADMALSRALHLVEKLGAGKVVSGRIVIGQRKEKREFSFPFSRIEWLLGIKVPEDDVLRILNNLGVETRISENEKGEEVLFCVVPEYRDDLEADCDIIEEIIRVYGYDKIVPTLLENACVTKGGRTERQKREDEMKRILVGRGYNEITTYPFGGKTMYERIGLDPDKENAIRVRNPLGEEFSIMRTTLVPNMLAIMESNLNKKNSRLRLFEYGKRYLADKVPLADELPREVQTLCIGATGCDFFELSRTVRALAEAFNIEVEFVRSSVSYMHPGVSADVLINGKTVGYFGKLHPAFKDNFDFTEDVFVGELDFDTIQDNATLYEKYRNFGRYPTSSRDLAILVDSAVLAGDVEKTIKSVSRLITDVRLFDVYRSPVLGNKKSLAFSVTFGSFERTLRDDEIESAVNDILKALEDRFDAKLRS